MAATLLRARGRSVVTIGFEGLSDALDGASPSAGARPDDIRWVRLGDLTALERVLRELDATELLLIGSVPKSLVFDESGIVAPDAEAARLLAGLRDRGDDALLAALTGWLSDRGFDLWDQATLLAPLRAPAGPLTRQGPDPLARRDLAAGLPVLHALGRAGIGQCVVVKAGTVVAVEAVEGTDETIRRAGRLAGDGATVIKAARPGQDRRIDLPVVGRETIAAMVEAGARALALESGSVLVLDRDEVVTEADRQGIVVWGFPSDSDGERP